MKDTISVPDVDVKTEKKEVNMPKVEVKTPEDREQGQVKRTTGSGPSPTRIPAPDGRSWPPGARYIQAPRTHGEPAR